MGLSEWRELQVTSTRLLDSQGWLLGKRDEPRIQMGGLSAYKLAGGRKKSITNKNWTLWALTLCWASPVAQLVKNPPARRETWVWSLGWEDALEKGKATHSSILAWGIPWSPWDHKKSDTTERLHSLTRYTACLFIFVCFLLFCFLVGGRGKSSGQEEHIYQRTHDKVSTHSEAPAWHSVPLEQEAKLGVTILTEMINWLL